MAIDFTMPPHVIEVRDKVRAFIQEEIEPAEAAMQKNGNWREGIIELRRKARQRGLWLPHMPKEFGGLGLDAMAIAMISAECGRARLAAFILNVQAPDEGNMHTLLHFATPEQKEKYLRPLCDGKVRSCFAMTEPEAAGSDPTQIKTAAVKQGDNWVLNGHKWFISGAHGAKFAIVIAKTDPEADPPQARNSAFIVELPNPGFRIVRDIDTMAGKGNHCEIMLENCVVPSDSMLGPRGQGHTAGALHAVDRECGSRARDDGQAGDGAAGAGRAVGRQAGHSVHDERVGDGAVHGEADGAARGLPDREQAAVSAGSVDGEASCGEHAVEDNGSRDPGAWRARLFDRHAAGVDAAACAIGAAG